MIKINQSSYVEVDRNDVFSSISIVTDLYNTKQISMFSIKDIDNLINALQQAKEEYNNG